MNTTPNVTPNTTPKATPKAIDANTDRLLITWADGKTSNLAARLLRISCNCASCVSEISGQHTLDETKISADIKITAAEPTGNYAVSLKFSDYHNTGIYSYEFLRKL